MNKSAITLGVVAVVVLGLLYWVFGMPSVGNPPLPTDAASLARGEYLFNAGGCGACHQPEGAPGNIGGWEVEQIIPVMGIEFGGTFRAPNITPDPETGIGGWTGRDFLLALKHGRAPGGGFYWPAFPFRTFMDMNDEDVLAIGAYLMAQEPMKSDVPDNDLPAYQFDWMMAGWNIMAGFMEGEYPAVDTTDPQIARGAYLARALGHCSECHTPRNALGMLQRGNEFAGSEIVTAQISPEGLAGWGTEDFVGFLQLGMTASFDFVGGEMAEVIKHTSLLSIEDQEAYAAFFLREQ